MRTLSIAFVAVALAASATAQDLTISRVGGGGSDFAYYGQSGGIHAYSFGTTSCNVGDVVVEWGPTGSSSHPVIAQNFFRIANGRIEQLGQSFLKHGFCAVNEGSCGTCQSTPCSTLGIGCADTYGSGLNDGIGGGRKSEIDPTGGVHQDPRTGPTGGGILRGRLQVKDSEWGNAGETYIAESQYVSEHDQMNGNVRNNASWRHVSVNPSNFDVNAVSETQIGDPAIFAWAFFDPEVTVVKVFNTNEGGTGVHGLYFLGNNVTDLGGGLWRYEYALFNMSSGRAAGAFSVPLCEGTVNITDTFFRDVDYHSGEPYDNTDWTTDVTSGLVKWETTTPHSVNPNGNALRWGTLYNFGFTADAPPANTNVNIDLFVPGTPTSLTPVAPGPCPVVDCGSVAIYCDPAVPNSSGGPAEMVVGGSLDHTDNALELTATQLPLNKIGYFITGQGTNVFTPPGSEGSYCIGGAPLRRLLPPPSNSGDTGMGYGEFTRTPDISGLPIVAGSTWNFQAWFRDDNPSNTSNFTNAAAVTFCD